MKTCTQCGGLLADSEFYRGKSECKPCFRARQRRYNSTHGVERRDYNQTYYESHRADLMAAQRDWYSANYRATATYRERALASAIKRDGRLNKEERAVHTRIYATQKTKEWARDHPVRWAAHMRAKQFRRKARKLGAAGDARPGQIAARWDFYGGRCWMCGDEAAGMDHVIPLSKGGSNWPANLRPACASCNSRKHDKSPKEMSPWRSI